jgi:pimeloyl-ACP methyl ester carboxylesterase
VSGVAITHHTIQANGVKYHYVASGSGPTTVVLLHGWPTTWYHWHRIIPKLAEHYTVVAPDLRGLGLTDKPYDGYDKKTVAEDIFQLIRSVGQERVYVVGHDIGGMVAFALAHEHPEAVRKLVIMDVPIPGLVRSEKPSDKSTQNIWWPAFHQVRDLPEALVAGNVRAYLEYFYKLSAYDPAAIGEEETAEYVREYSRPGALRAGFAYYRAFGEDVKTNKYYAGTKLRMPVLALMGATSTEKDMVFQLEPVAETLRGAIIEKAGHFLASEQPEEVVRRLLEFFAEH